ncbi:MAG: phenylacetate--CoA ligase [Acidimicrobiaceae bacterium]|nr:phenylacetate--CoA ligase [Acidimicrobiaceae bacterium]MYI36212.1 phenylacetate--CoA ligase [Acidimicrobiaceae bacterium]
MVSVTDPAHYEAIESASIDELRGVQLVRLREILGHAYANVAHYRHAFERAGVGPDDLRDLADLARFPFLTKADLRDNYPFGLFAVPRSEVVRVHASSGTTGKPTVVGYTAGDIDAWSRLMARSIYAAGGRPGDVAHVAYGYGLFTGGLGAHYGAETLGCMVVPVSGGQTERQVTLIMDFEPRIILVTPSYCLNLIDEMEVRGIDPRSCSLEVGIFGAEPWTDELRAEIESRLGIDAVDIYGLSEVMGPGVAQECVETKDGPTLWEDHFYPEIIDPGTGEPLPDGEFGELVLTALTKRGQPVIRYRTRDLTRLLPGTARPMRRIERISGRSDDMLIVRGVNVFPSQIEAEVLKVDGLTPHFQIEVDRSGNLAQLTVRVERSPSAHRPEDDLASELADHVKGNIGVTVDVVVAEPGAVPRSAGKAQRVVPAE